MPGTHNQACSKRAHAAPKAARSRPSRSPLAGLAQIKPIVRAEGFEPTRSLEHRHLKPACLPFHHARKRRRSYRDRSSVAPLLHATGVSCNTTSWQHQPKEPASTVAACANAGTDPFRCGCPTYGPRNSPQKPTGKRSPWLTPTNTATTWISSKRSPTSPGMNDPRRVMDGFGRGLRQEATACAHHPG